MFPPQLIPVSTSHNRLASSPSTCHTSAFLTSLRSRAVVAHCKREELLLECTNTLSYNFPFFRNYTKLLKIIPTHCSLLLHLR